MVEKQRTMVVVTSVGPPSFTKNTPRLQPYLTNGTRRLTSTVDLQFSTYAQR